MIDAATQTVLIPGSVWSRKTKQGEVEATVLFITNQGLDADVLVKNPQQVVFLTHKLEVYSMTIERFLKNRDYATMNPDVETLVKALTAPVNDEDGDEIDIDSIQLPEDSDGDSDVSLEDQEPATAAVGETFETTGNLLAVQAQNMPSSMPVLSLSSTISPALAQLLGSRFISYAEAMSPAGTGDTLHTLRFALTPDLGLDQLNDAFGLTGPISEFTISSAVTPTTVEIDGFVQVWLEVIAPMGGHPSQSYGLVQVTSLQDIREKQRISQTPQPAAAPATQVVADAVYSPPEVEDDAEPVTTTKPGVAAFIIDAQKPTPAAAEPVINLAAMPIPGPAPAPAQNALNVTAA